MVSTEIELDAARSQDSGEQRLNKRPPVRPLARSNAKAQPPPLSTGRIERDNGQQNRPDLERPEGRSVGVHCSAAADQVACGTASQPHCTQMLTSPSISATSYSSRWGVNRPGVGSTTSFHRSDWSRHGKHTLSTNSAVYPRRYGSGSQTHANVRRRRQLNRQLRKTKQCHNGHGGAQNPYVV